MEGEKYNRLTAVRRVKIKSRYWHWLFICDCGKEKIARMSHVKFGGIQSCGCFMREKATQMGIRHNETGPNVTTEYKAWASMINRCTTKQKNSGGYKHYVLRGIKICDRWLGKEGYSNFLYDMGRKPTPAHTLDRLDFNGNYEPGNCRWATVKEQGENKRGLRLLTYKGVTKSATLWAEEHGILPVTLYGRLNRGMPVKEALTTPIDITKSRKGKRRSHNAKH